MSSDASHASPYCFDIKSAQWPLVTLQLRSTDCQVLMHDMARRYGEQVDFFDHDPMLVDLTAIDDVDQAFDAVQLIKVLKSFKLNPLAYKGGSAVQRMAANAAGLVLADDARTASQSHAAAAPEVTPHPIDTSSQHAPTQPEPSRFTTQFLDKPLRSGQQFYARGGDLVVTAMVNPGAEVVADGHIHIYAPLRGKAIAGARGNTQARIFVQTLDAELLSIAGVYRTSDIALPQAVKGRAAHIRLEVSDQGERLLIEPL